MSYKNLHHYRHTVHRYLDAIWIIGSKKNKTRTSMYRILSNRMGIPFEETHVKYFTRAQCREAIKILRPMYIQLYGKDLEFKKGGNKEMYYTEKKYSSVTINYYKENIVNNVSSFTNVVSVVNIIVYCKGKKLDDSGIVSDYETIDNFITNIIGKIRLNELIDGQITLERLAKYIYDQIVTCYKIDIITEDGTLYTYEEEEI